MDYLITDADFDKKGVFKYEGNKFPGNAVIHLNNQQKIIFPKGLKVQGDFYSNAELMVVKDILDVDGNLSILFGRIEGSISVKGISKFKTLTVDGYGDFNTIVGDSLSVFGPFNIFGGMLLSSALFCYSSVSLKSRDLTIFSKKLDPDCPLLMFDKICPSLPYIDSSSDISVKLFVIFTEDKSFIIYDNDACTKDDNLKSIYGPFYEQIKKMAIAMINNRDATNNN